MEECVKFSHNVSQKQVSVYYVVISIGTYNKYMVCGMTIEFGKPRTTSG